VLMDRLFEFLDVLFNRHKKGGKSFNNVSGLNTLSFALEKI